MLLLALPTLGTLLIFLIYLAVVLLIAWMAYYLINNLAPEPVRRMLNVVLIVVLVIGLCYFLLTLVGPLPK